MPIATPRMTTIQMMKTKGFNLVGNQSKAAEFWCLRNTNNNNDDDDHKEKRNGAEERRQIKMKITIHLAVIN